MLKRVLKNLLLFAIFVLLVWLAVIAYWQMTHRLPDESEVVMYLVLLPLGLLLGYWVLKKSIDGIQHWLAGVGAVASYAAAGATSAPTQNDKHDVRERAFTLELMATALRLPQADTASSLLDLLQEPKFEPKPSAALITSAGSPVLCTEVQEGGSSQALRDELFPLAALHSPDHELSDSWLRSALLIQPVLETLVEAAQKNLPAPEALALTPHLRVHLLLPEAWPESHRQLMEHWLKKMVLSGAWPESKWSLTFEPCGARLECVSVLEQWNILLNREQLDDLCILVAADSALDSQVIQQWETHEQLFSATQMKGRIPGEGAAGVLVRRRIDPKAESYDTASIYVHRAALGRRAKSADEGRAAGGQLLPELAQQAASAANVPIENIAVMIADTDHRAHRFMEVVQASNSLAKIKKDEDFSAWSTGQSMGYAGAAATLAALSACKEYAAEEKKPVLWCSAQDDFERAVVVVSAMNF